MKELSEKEALCKAASYCSSTEHCLSEVADKLAQWGVVPDVAELVLKYLVAERYVDEVRFCKSFVADKFRFNKWGKVKIVQALKQKSVPSSLYATALEGIDEEEYMAMLRDLIATKKRGTKAKNSYELKGKLIRFALGRGFEMETIQRCIRLPEDDDEMDY